jgi:hypothetical protein
VDYLTTWTVSQTTDHPIVRVEKWEGYGRKGSWYILVLSILVLSTTTHPIQRVYNIGELPLCISGWTEEIHEKPQDSRLCQIYFV